MHNELSFFCGGEEEGAGGGGGNLGDKVVGSHWEVEEERVESGIFKVAEMGEVGKFFVITHYI